MNQYSLIFNYRDNKHYNLELNSIIKKRGYQTYEDWILKNQIDLGFTPICAVNDRNGVLGVCGFLKNGITINKTSVNSVLITNQFVKSKAGNDDMVDQMIKGVINKYERIVDLFYTFSNNENDQTLIRNGFKKAKEYTYFMQWDQNVESELAVVKKLSPENNAKDLEFIKDYLFHSAKENSLFSVKEDKDLQIYNLLKYYKNNIYYLANLDAIVMFSITGHTFQLMGLYSKNEINIKTLLENIVPKGISLIEFYFVPNIKNKFVVKELRKIMVGEEHHRSFVYIRENTTNLEASKFIFPLLNRLK
ncbi:Hypothetical protein MYEA_4430 [Mycoplasma yeatsii 13926]|uniref:N-acetyltransferase domain-containing protein n=1 Tax=Mycoplasma yeatsii 13926 TaxID=1188240 RepID=S6G8Q9_9MOLU|nr:hypothetical protein [Mycoplasma yeatsii]EOA07180.1 Hypothetical protein MYEA_4430 [Mycoplasma yeatsii 13926]